MLPEKEVFYENATKKLLDTIDKMKMDKLPRMRAKNLVLLFRDSFKLPDIKQKTFKDNTDCFTYASDGFCRVSSINFALMMGGMPDWQLRYIGDLWTYGPHHYLFHVPSKTILDLTYDQYAHAGLEIPYHLSKAIDFDFEKDDSAVRFAQTLGLQSLATNKKQKD